MVISRNDDRRDICMGMDKVSSMTPKEIFEKNLRGHEYLKARGLSPDTAMQGEREGRRLEDKLPAVLNILENWK